jgi:predicted nucleic acid-binding Zn ribbon protein
MFKEQMNAKRFQMFYMIIVIYAVLSVFLK